METLLGTGPAPTFMYKRGAKEGLGGLAGAARGERCGAGRKRERVESAE